MNKSRKDLNSGKEKPSHYRITSPLYLLGAASDILRVLPNALLKPDAFIKVQQA